MVKFQNVQVDDSKCTTPFNCKICLEICPQAVFYLRPVKMEKFKETDKTEPGSYTLKPLFRDKCTACNQCVEACPVGAIRIVNCGQANG